LSRKKSTFSQKNHNILCINKIQTQNVEELSPSTESELKEFIIYDLIFLEEEL